MPKTVKVGPHTYAIVRPSKKDAPDIVGDSDFDLMRIRVRHGVRKSKAQETLLHELLHATTYPSFTGAYENEDKFTPEQIISAVAPVLLGVLQDNPKLLEYLTK